MKLNPRLLLNVDSAVGGGSKKNSNQPTMVTVNMPKEPPKEVLEQSFSMADLPKLDEGEGQQVFVEDKTSATKKADTTETPANEEVKKEEVKSEEKKEEKKLPSYIKPPKEEKREEAKVEEKGEAKSVLKAPTEDKFDYKGFSDSEVTNLKNMSRQSREYAANLIRENKELSKLKDSTYLQDPNAYVLSPQYKQKQEEVYSADEEGRAWMTQLELIKAGKPFKPIVGWKDGKLMYGAEMASNDKMEEAVRLNAQACFNAAHQFKGQLAGIKDTFSNSINNDLQGITAERAKRFEWVADPKLMEYTVMFDGKDTSIKDIRNQFVSIFPAYLRNHPSTQVSADLIVSLAIARAELAEMTGQKKVVETKIEEVKRAEPGSSDKPAPKNGQLNGVPNNFSLEGMPT